MTKQQPSGHPHLSPATILLLTGVAAAFALMYIFTVPHGDDLRLTIQYSWLNNGNLTFDGTAYRGFIRYFIDNENARLPNMLFPLFGIFMPRWVAGVLAGACVSFSIWLVCRLTAGRVDFRRVTAVTFLTLFLLPWRDSLFQIDMGLNYVVTMVLYLGFIAALMRVPETATRTGRMTAVCVFGVICAWMHEGFAIPTLCGACSLLICRRYRIPAYYILLAIFAVTTALCMSAPGTVNRILTQGAEASFFQNLRGFAVKSSVTLLTYCIMLIGLTMRRCRKSLLEFVSEPLILFSLVASAISLAIAFKAGTGHRPYWFANLTVILIWCRWAFTRIAMRDSVKNILTTVACAVIAVFLPSTVAAQIESGQKTAHALALLRANGFRPVYADIPGGSGILNWGYVTGNLWEDEAYINDIKDRYRLKAAPALLPSSMRHADWNSPEPLNPEGSVVRIGDQLFVKESALYLHGDRYRAYKKLLGYDIDGHRMVLNSLLTPLAFTDSIEYFWIRPERRINLSKVTFVENLPDPDQ